MTGQRVLVVLSFDIEGGPDTAGEELLEAVRKIDPPSLPHFAGQMRVVVSPQAGQVERWLDDGQPPAPDGLGRPYRYGDPKPYPAGNRAQRRARGRRR